MVQTVWLTQAGKSRLEEELQDLRTRRRPELHARIQEATESGDISDNSEYEDLKEGRVLSLGAESLDSLGELR